MINDQKVLAIIPARGGSKGLPNKNIRMLNNKPLISYTIEEAKKSKLIDKMVVSTDSDKIANIAQAHQIEVMRRPNELSLDNSLIIDTLRHVIGQLELQNQFFDICLLLQPTSPLRTVAITDICLQKLAENVGQIDSLATFSETSISPHRLWNIKDNKLSTYIDGAVPWLPRQELPKAYALNGLCYAFYIKSLQLYPDTISLLFGNALPIVTSGKMNLDIDTLSDLQLAEYILKKEIIG